MAKFMVKGQRATSSNTLSITSIVADVGNVAGAVRRGKLFGVTFGSEATAADAAFLLAISRITNQGTVGTVITPQMFDPADAATAADGGSGHTVDCTITANSEVVLLPVNQRTSLALWIPPGREPIYPATTQNGFNSKTPTINGSNVAVTSVLYIDEQ